MDQNKNDWRDDHLGSGFQMKQIDQPDDYSGKVKATVIRKLSGVATDKAILYVHGFSDYFFQQEMAEMFVVNGYNFYAVDLRKYGRSLMPGQKMFQVRDLKEYFADINSTIDIIKKDDNKKIILIGHSTGGLTTSLYMSDHPSPMIKALILNSPFLDWNMSSFMKKVVIPIVSKLGAIFPDVKVKQKPDSGYAETLSSEHGGEWSYRKDWKPDILPDPDMGWIRAIHKAQQNLRRGKVKVPVLLLHSGESVKRGDSKEKYYRADAILDVESISRYGKRLGEDVTEVSFSGGLHDLALSRKNIREKVYTTMLDWLKTKNL